MLGILILQKKHPERIKKIDKQIVKQLNYDKIEFLVQGIKINKIEIMNIVCINVYAHENKLAFRIYVSGQNFQDSMDLLLLKNDNNSHYVYIKNFDRFMFHKTKNRNKKWFCRSCLQCFSRESVLIKHKENCLSINGKQSVKLGKGIIEFKNYFEQIPVPFKIYADFECNLRVVGSYEGSYKKDIKTTFLLVLLMKLFVLMIGLANELLFIEVKILLMNLLKQFLRSINIAKK